MFASIRNAASRGAFRRLVGTNVRTMTTEAGEAAAQATLPAAAAQTDVLSTMSSRLPAAARPSSLVQPNATPVIHIPPAEDPLLHLFTNLMMFHGKRQQASRVVTRMLLHIHAFTKAPPMPILRQAIFTASPLLRCRSFKRAAKQYVFPIPLNERQRTRQAIKWIFEQANKSKGGKNLEERLAREVIAVVKGDSEVIKWKDAVHKLAVLHRGNVVKPPKVPKSNRG